MVHRGAGQPGKPEDLGVIVSVTVRRLVLEHLAELVADAPIAGLYDGDPTRGTVHTAERVILEALGGRADPLNIVEAH